VAAFASAANMRVIDPLLVQLAASFDVSVGAASIAATAFLFANGVFVLVHGPFGDRYGKMPVVAIACITAALCCVLSALAASLGWLTLARFLTGVTGSAIIPLSIAWLGDNVSYERRQATLARFLTGQTLGLMTGAALGGAIGDWLGWRSVFWVLAAIYIAAGGALFAVMRARPDLARASGHSQGSMIGQMLRVLRRRWVITVVLVVALEGGTFWGAFTFVGAIIFTMTRNAEHHHVPQEALIGIVYVVAAAAGILLLSNSAEGTEELRRTLIGDVLLVTKQQVWRTFALYVGVAAVHFMFRRKFFAISFEPGLAEASGMAVLWWDFLFYVLFGLVVTSFVQIGGVLLVFSYLIVPAVCANFLANKLSSLLIIGWITATVASVVGLYSSYRLDLPTGAAIVCALGTALLLVGLYARFFRKQVALNTEPVPKAAPH